MSGNNNLQPEFWVLRPQSNTMVPLIAVDELPANVTVRGVPRSLNAKDLHGMTCAGIAEARHNTHIIDMPKEAVANPSVVMPIRGTLNDSMYATTANSALFSQPPKTYGISEQMPSHNKPSAAATAIGSKVAVASASAAPVSASVTAPASSFSATAPLRTDRKAGAGPLPLPPWQDTSAIPLKAAPGVKEYCSYWLRCGECDYAQQGCLYKHEMPLDRQVLERLGHRDIPKWYREKHGLGSYLAAGALPGSGGSAGARGDRGREQERKGGDKKGGAGGGGSKAKETNKTGKPVKGAKMGKGKGNGRSASKTPSASLNKSADGPVSSSSATTTKTTPTKTMPVNAAVPAPRGPSASEIIANGGHYRSPMAKRCDERTLQQLEAYRVANEEKKSVWQRLVGGQLSQKPARRAHAQVAQVAPPAPADPFTVTPETMSDEECEGSGAGSAAASGGKAKVKWEETEWMEGPLAHDGKVKWDAVSRWKEGDADTKNERAAKALEAMSYDQAAAIVLDFKASSKDAKEMSYAESVAHVKNFDAFYQIVKGNSK